MTYGESKHKALYRVCTNSGTFYKAHDLQTAKEIYYFLKDTKDFKWIQLTSSEGRSTLEVVLKHEVL